MVSTEVAAKAVGEQPQQARAAQDVATRIEDVADPLLFFDVGHKLHQAAGSGAADDVRIVVGLDVNHRADQRRRQGVDAGRFGDKRIVAVIAIGAGIGGWHDIGARLIAARDAAAGYHRGLAWPALPLDAEAMRAGAAGGDVGEVNDAVFFVGPDIGLRSLRLRDPQASSSAAPAPRRPGRCRRERTFGAATETMRTA